ncbi:MAG: hypothetical protein SAL70_41975, partial [Scytonema sp. PMC 1070.18]|nr:hypothetical protein [Scytonema sp. PMC 1070.18]
NVNAVTFSPCGEYIISASNDATLRLWDNQGNPIGNPFTGHQSNINAVAFSPSGEYIVSGGEDCTLILWDTKGNLRGNPFTGHQSRVTSVAFSSDGKLIVSGSSDGSLRIWDLKGNHVIAPIAFSDVWVDCVAFSPDGKQIVCGINNDPLSGRGFEGILRIWDTEGHPIGNPFTGHCDSVTSVAFSPDGTLIVSGGADSTVRLWDQQGNSIGNPFTGHCDSVTCVAFSPDGEKIVSGSFDGTVRLWQVDWVLWLQIACDRLRHHPLFKNPETEVASQACEICKNYIWNPSIGVQKLYEQAMQRMKDEENLENFLASEEKIFSAVLPILNVAIRFNSTHASVYYLRGKCYAKLNNLPQATQDFQKAAALCQQLGQTSSKEYQEVIKFLNQL